MSFRKNCLLKGFDDKGLIDAKAPRRDFLKYLGFSTAAATLAASCKIPVKKAIPYANKPENLIPGVAKYYATTYVQDGDVIPVVAKVRDGRPIKIEGNTLHHILVVAHLPVHRLLYLIYMICTGQNSRCIK